jgi:hypothetical protein
MPNPILSTITLFSVHIGFSALFGYWIYTLQRSSNLRFQLMPLSLVAALLIAANVSAPIGNSAKIVLAVLSLIIIVICAFRFERLSISPDWAWLYAAFSMASILLWSIVQGQAILSIAMSLFALVAFLLALQRGNQKIL